jgi:hypothetical protein
VTVGAENLEAIGPDSSFAPLSVKPFCKFSLQNLLVLMPVIVDVVYLKKNEARFFAARTPSAIVIYDESASFRFSL